VGLKNPITSAAAVAQHHSCVCCLHVGMLIGGAVHIPETEVTPAIAAIMDFIMQ
jgi:hypothetical protein